MPTLHVISGDLNAKTFDLAEARITIGRATENTVMLDHTTVSKNHAMLVKNGSEYKLFDFHSTNGTYVNDERIAVALLRNGDRIRMGDVEVCYEVAAAEPTASVQRTQQIPAPGLIQEHKSIPPSPVQKQTAPSPAAKPAETRSVPLQPSSTPFPQTEHTIHLNLVRPPTAMLPEPKADTEPSVPPKAVGEGFFGKLARVVDSLRPEPKVEIAPVQVLGAPTRPGPVEPRPEQNPASAKTTEKLSEPQDRKTAAPPADEKSPAQSAATVGEVGPKPTRAEPPLFPSPKARDIAHMPVAEKVSAPEVSKQNTPPTEAIVIEGKKPETIREPLRAGSVEKRLETTIKLPSPPPAPVTKDQIRIAPLEKPLEVALKPSSPQSSKGPQQETRFRTAEKRPETEPQKIAGPATGRVIPPAALAQPQPQEASVSEPEPASGRRRLVFAAALGLGLLLFFVGYPIQAQSLKFLGLLTAVAGFLCLIFDLKFGNLLAPPKRRLQ
jgi:hypothetical protein